MNLLHFDPKHNEKKNHDNVNLTYSKRDKIICVSVSKYNIFV